MWLKHGELMERREKTEDSGLGRARVYSRPTKSQEGTSVLLNNTKETAMLKNPRNLVLRKIKAPHTKECTLL